jgi:hypothetical protein
MAVVEVLELLGADPVGLAAQAPAARNGPMRRSRRRLVERPLLLIVGGAERDHVRGDR